VTYGSILRPPPAEKEFRYVRIPSLRRANAKMALVTTSRRQCRAHLLAPCSLDPPQTVFLKAPTKRHPTFSFLANAITNASQLATRETSTRASESDKKTVGSAIDEEALNDGTSASRFGNQRREPMAYRSLPKSELLPLARARERDQRASHRRDGHFAQPAYPKFNFTPGGGGGGCR